MAPRRAPRFSWSVRSVLVVASSLALVTPFVANVGARVAAADTVGPTTILVGPPAVASSDGYVATVTAPTPFAIPAVSDAAGDSFVFSITGVNSAECVVTPDGQNFTYEHPGTCVVLITASVTDNDGDEDATEANNPSTCREHFPAHLRTNVRRVRVAHLASARASDATNCTASTTLTLTVDGPTRAIVVGAPATGGDGVFSASVTAPTPFQMPPVSDGVSSDTFTYSLTGSDSAGCATSTDAATFTYQRVGSCAVLITAVPATSDSDGDPGDGTTTATATLNLVVLAHAQTISLSSATVNFGATHQLTATGFLGTGTISYDLVDHGTASGCQINGAHEVSASTAGTCLVQAHIDADGTYAAATSNVATITFLPAPVIPPPSPPPPPVTTTTAPPVTTTTSPPVTTTTLAPPVIVHRSLSLASGALTIGQSWRLQVRGLTGPGTITYDVLERGTASGCQINGAHEVRASTVGTCLVQVHIGADGTYAAATSNIATVDFLVVTQSLSLSSGRVKFAGSWPLHAFGYHGDAAVTYRVVGATATGCSIDAANVLTAAGAGTCRVTASMAAKGNYSSATSNVATIIFDRAPVLPKLVIKNSPVPAPPRPKLPPTVSMSVASFAEGSYLLSAPLAAQVNAIAARVSAKKYHVVDLTSYTDNVFTPAFNLALNAQRASAVRAQLLADLAARHVTGVRVVVVTTPTRYVFTSRSNVSATGRAYNRRVVATLFAY